jgi:hypothetical protein
MAEQAKEVKKYEIQEDELNVLLAFVGKRPLEEALQSFGIIQAVTQRPIEEKKKPVKRTTKKTE